MAIRYKGLAVPIWRLVILIAMVGAGWGLSHVLDIHADTPEYLYGATVLLAIGLYGSTAQISCTTARRLAESLRHGVHPVFRPEDYVNIRIVGLAVTVGVIFKAALITLVMYEAFHEPLYLVLGIAMAQIDPLSVVALRRSSGLSGRAKTILHIWSSFDDPVTMLLTIYLAALALSMMGRNGGLVGADLVSFAWDTLMNLGFAAGAAIVWWMLTRSTRRARTSDSGDDKQADSKDGKKIELPAGLNLVAAVALAALVAVAVWQFLMLGLAIAGLFFRPRLGPWLTRATGVALLLASLALGVLLVHHVAWGQGLLLGLTAFVAQVVVALMLTWKLPFQDRGFLALSQQNGITAIILALLLESSFAGTVAVVAPAIIVTNILHVCSTAAFAKRCQIRAAIIKIFKSFRVQSIRFPIKSFQIRATVISDPVPVTHSPVAETAESAKNSADCTRLPKSSNDLYASAKRVDPSV